MDFYEQAVDLGANPKHMRWAAPILLIADACLCALVIWKIPYTEIDWTTYMQQVSQYIHGERDYTLIKGATGPLVYPAAHVYIYSALYYITDQGRNIQLAQMIFGGLYLLVLSMVMACYRSAGAPPYLFPLLVISKRLHSIFVLRLFNDCFAVGALWLTIYAYQKRWWTIGNVAFSWGVGTKMSLLLAAPAVGIVTLLSLPLIRAVKAAMLVGQVQVLLAFPFLPVNGKGYFYQAFDFSRQFLFKWTVNWRFIGEEAFSSREFSLGLLFAHASLLTAFLTTRWIRPSGLSIGPLTQKIMNEPATERQQSMFLRVDFSFIMTTILTAVAVGMLCARSLHYQFYAYIAWATPFLLWKSGLHPFLIYAVWAAQESAWNVYPSTDVSSGLVVGCLALQVVGVWWGTRHDFANVTFAKMTE